MSASASIVYLRLDASGDPVFDPSSELLDLAAVEQAIKTRLLFFEGEWWENLNEGTPMFQEILGQRASSNGIAVMSAALSARVAGTPFVSSVLNAIVAFDPTTRKFTFTCTAQTSFGTIPINFSPGASAGVNG
jgi:hypothetical protein